MEAIENQFLRSLGLPIVKQEGDVFYGWPRRSASFEFKSPVRFGDVVRLKIVVKEIRIRSVRYGVTVRLEDDVSTLVARGELTTVWTRINPNNGVIESVPFSRRNGRGVGRNLILLVWANIARYFYVYLNVNWLYFQRLRFFREFQVRLNQNSLLFDSV